MRDSRRMPVISEPFFLQLDAEISCAPVMNMEDVQKGLCPRWDAEPRAKRRTTGLSRRRPGSADGDRTQPTATGLG